jgi:hypothetical protein
MSGTLVTSGPNNGCSINREKGICFCCYVHSPALSPPVSQTNVPCSTQSSTLKMETAGFSEILVPTSGVHKLSKNLGAT